MSSERCQDNTVQMFYGAASGQQRAALQRLEPEAVMISHATQNNTPWEGPDTFIDCGGYHHMMTGGGEYEDTNAEYVDFIDEHRPEMWALRDYPCEPDLLEELGRSVRDQQSRTLDRHIELRDMVDGSPLAKTAVSVVQGWTVEQYLRHLEEMRDHGVLGDRVAIGSVCRRHADRDIARVILSVRDALGDGPSLHAFGVKGSVLRFEEVCEALDSVDSAAYDYAPTNVPSERADGERFTWRDCARAYLNWRHQLMQKMATESLHGGSMQTTLEVTG